MAEAERTSGDSVWMTRALRHLERADVLGALLQGGVERSYSRARAQFTRDYSASVAEHRCRALSPKGTAWMSQRHCSRLLRE